MTKTLEVLSKIFPAFEWMSDYQRSDIRGDLSAGLTVGVMLIPQSMAYAMLAGMPAIYGLYASLVPLMIYALLGTSRHLSFGPVAVDMLVVAAGVGALAGGQSEHIKLAILVTAMTGIIEILMGIFRFGFMVNYLSRPVIAGFMTAAPLIIAASQLGNLTGLELPDTQYVHILVWATIQKLGAINAVTLVVGGSGVGLLLVLQKLKPKWPSALIWVVLATVASWVFGLDAMGLETVGDVPEGLPPLEVPGFSWAEIVALAPTALTLALVQFMTVMSLGKVFAADHDYSVDANRELFAVGSANTLGSLFGSVPVSGSFSRSAVNNRSGANTPLTNIIAATMVGLTLILLTPLFEFLPISALAAIIIVASIGMIDVPELRHLLQTRWLDGAVALLTFGATLGIGIQQGILIGVAASILVVLWDLSRPKVVELGHMPGTQEFRDVSRNPEAEPISDIHIIRIDSRFSFANAELLKDELLEEAGGEKVRALIIEAQGVNDLDTTASQALKKVVEELSERDLEFFVVGAKGPVRDMMRRSGLMELIGEENFYLNTHLAVSDLLERWEAEEKYELTEQEQRLDQMDQARQRLEEERERMAEERRTIIQERKRLEEEIDEHEYERSQLDDQRRQLRGRLERLRQRRDRLGEEADQRRALAVEHEEIAEEREELAEEKEQLAEERDQLEAEKEKLEDRQEELEVQEQALHDERDDVLRERDRLEAELAEAVAERRQLDETRRDLADQLERAEQERRRMEQQQEQLEAERQRLEAERRKARGEEEADSETPTGGGADD